MKQELLNEIKRIKEVMGVSVSKPLILEDSIIKRAATSIKNIFRGLNPNIPVRGRITPTGTLFNFNLPSINKVISATQKEIDDMVKYLDNTLAWKDLTDNSKKFFKDILSETGLLDGVKLYNDVVDGIIQGGSDEEVWLKNIIKKSEYVDPLTRREIGLKGALEEILQDDDGILTDAIQPSLAKKIDDYKKGILSLQDGKLVSNVNRDVEDFLVNATKFTDDEIRRMSNPKFIERIKGIFSRMNNEVITIKNLFKNYGEEGLGIQERERIEKLILEKMNTLSNYELECAAYMKKFIDELANSGDPEAVKIAKRLKDLETKNGGWDVIKVLAHKLPPLQKQWIAFKEAFRNAFALERAIGRTLRIDKAGERVSTFLRKLFRTQVVEKSLKQSEGTTTNTLLMNSPRGWPMRKIVSELNEGKVDYYEKLKKIGGMNLAKISYFEEYAIRLVKTQIELNLIKVLLERIRYESASREELDCLLLLTKEMQARKIYDSKQLVGPYKNKAEWIPPCIYKLNKERLSAIFDIADYMTSLNANDGEYWRGDFQEKMKDINFYNGLLKLQPVRGLELGIEIWKAFTSFMDKGDLEAVTPEPPPPPQPLTWEETEPSFRLWCEGQVPPHTFESWDTSTKKGSADGKKWKLNADKSGFEEDTTTPTPVVTTDTTKLEEFKDFLRNEYPTKTFNNPIHIGGNKYKPSDDSPVTFEYENGKFIAK